MKIKRKTVLKYINKRTISIMIILFGILYLQISLSKYVEQLYNEHIQQSTQFYFESDIADVNSKEYQIKNWNGTDIKKFDFYVKNYENNLLKSDEDIFYNITINITDENNNNIENGTLINVYVKKQNTDAQLTEDNLLSTEFNSNNYVLIIEPVSGIAFTNGQVFKIGLSINSVAPYTKELLANIVLEVNQEASYETTIQEAENGEYTTLILKINNNTNDIIIKYDNSKLILDKSYYLVNSLTETTIDTINAFTIPKTELNIGESYRINFIKIENNTQITLGEDIQVE